MDASPLSSDADRIAFGSAADALEFGQSLNIADEIVQRYIELGLMARDVQGVLHLTNEGRDQRRITQGERFADG